MRVLSQKRTPVSRHCVGFLQRGEMGVSLPLEKPTWGTWSSLTDLVCSGVTVGSVGVS